MIYVSQSESRILGAKVGRLELSGAIQPEIIRKQIIELGLDVCRIKLPGNDPSLWVQLEKIGFPYFLLNINQAFELESKGALAIDGEVSFEAIKSANDKTLLAETVRQCFEGEPGTYFTNPLTKNIISKAAEMEAMIAFAVENCTAENYWAQLAKYEGKVAGFVLYSFHENTANGELFGVLPAFRKLGIGKDIGAHVINTFAGKRIVNHIKLQNLASIKTHLALGFEPGQLILNVHVVSLLSIKK
jgi:GNAT superfamily N-acetyltransferase